MEVIQSIQTRIYVVRGERIMLDRDLAELYQTETRVLNQAVKRNVARFPADFMFQLNEIEWSLLQKEIKTHESQNDSLRSQIVISKGGLRYLPYVFTEQGVAMLSSVLHSNRAVQMNIAIMRAFVEIRRITLQPTDMKTQLSAIIDKIGEHDDQLKAVYEALENMLDETAAKRKWDDRVRIGFRR